MSRVAVALLAIAVAGTMVHAATPTKKSASAAKKRAKKKRRARVAAKLAAKKVAAKAAPAHYAPDGRVYYGHDNMPPGFAWPANAAMKTGEKTCEQELDRLGIRWERSTPEGKIADPIAVPAMELGGVKYVSAYQKPPFTMDCQLVQTLAAIGPDLRALGVREIKFGSIYRNTLVRAHGVTKNILSRHALGLAMDIKSFTDDSGREASVELDYLKGDTLLHAIEDTINKSNRFRIVLTPGNDPISHYDHFHVEASVDYTAFR